MSPTSTSIAMSLALTVCITVGLAAGLGGYTFHQGEGLSYFGDDPQTCANCHVMRDQYDSWSHSSHSAWATCNDCHMPAGPIDGLYTKAINGWNHAYKFTTGDYPEPIVINDRNRRIALENCIRCHGAMTSEMRIEHADIGTYRCIECHGNVGHQGAK
jgi:cytochrome c nitrite reductase small subunit